MGRYSGNAPQGFTYADARAFNSRECYLIFEPRRMEPPNKQPTSKSEESSEGRDQGKDHRLPIQLRKEENQIPT